MGPAWVQGRGEEGPTRRGGRHDRLTLTITWVGPEKLEAAPWWASARAADVGTGATDSARPRQGVLRPPWST